MFGFFITLSLELVLHGFIIEQLNAENDGGVHQCISLTVVDAELCSQDRNNQQSSV